MMGCYRVWVLFLIVSGLAAQTTVFTLTEQTGRGLISHDSSHPNEDLDINSAVVLKPEKKGLLAYLGSPQVQQALIRRLQDVTEILTLRNQNLKDLNAFRDDLGRMSAADRVKQRDPILARLGSVATDLRRVNERTEAYVTGTRPATASVLLNRFALDSRQYDVFLSDEIQNLQNELKADQNQHAFRLELTATLPPGTPSVHIENYDTLKPGSPVVVDKTRFTFDASFQGEVDAAAKLAQAIKEGKGLQAGILTVVLADLPRENEQIKAISDAVAKLKADSATAATDFKARVQQDVKDGEALITSLQKDAASLGKLAETLSGTQDPATALKAIVEPLQSIEVTLESLQKKVAGLRAAILADARAAAGPLKDDLDNLLAAVVSLRALFHIDQATSTQIAFPSGAIAVPLDSAVDGRINLTTTSRREGDVLSIRAQVFPAGAAEGDPPLLEQQATFSIRKCGWVAVTGGAIQFVKVKDDPRNTYVTAPSAYAVYRYQGWPGQSMYRFWKVFAPGIGIATTAVPMADGTTRVGILGTVQFFGDIVQVSWGMTPSRDHLFSVGIGLQQLLGVGKIL